MSAISIIQLMKKEGLLTNQSNEFAKLSKTDKLVCLEVLSNNAGEIWAYLRYLCNNYRSKGVNIDCEKLLDDLNRFHKYALEMDNTLKNDQ